MAARTAGGRSEAARDEDRGPGRADRGNVAVNGRAIAKVEIEQDDVRVPARPGEQSVHGRRHGDDPDAAFRGRDPAGHGVENDGMVIHGRDVDDTGHAALPS